MENQIVDLLQKNRKSLGDIAKDAGICRNTLGNVLASPTRAKIVTLRAIAKAIGYKMIIDFVEDEKP